VGCGQDCPPHKQTDMHGGMGRLMAIADSRNEGRLTGYAIRFLVFIFFEAPFLAVIPVVRLVILPFTHTLLVSFVFRVILVVVPGVVLVVVLEKWSPRCLYRHSADTDTHRYRQHPDTVS